MEENQQPAGEAPAGTPPTTSQSLLNAPTPSTNQTSNNTSNQTPNEPSTNPYPKEDWRHSLPDDIRADESLKVFTDIPALAKSYIHTKKALGSDKVALPTKHSTDEDIQKFYDSLGRPALDKYEVATPKDAKFVSKEAIDKLKPLAHKAGILPAQLAPILEFHEKESQAAELAQQEALKAQISEGFKGLKNEWGKAFDQRGAWAKRLFAEHGSPELSKFLDENPGVGSNAMLIKFAAKVGEMLYKEDTVKGGQGGDGLIMDPTQAIQKANNIMADMKHPYNDNSHPNHAAAVREVNELFDTAYPKPLDS